MARIVEYTELAKYYDLLFSHSKDYEAESREIRRLITKHKKTKGDALLDVGCGTGRHLLYLKRWYDCAGMDLNQEMLDIAKRAVKGVPFKRADMMRFRTPKRFDIVTCLFSAIGYAMTYEGLDRTIRNFHSALKPGGVLIIDGWFDRKGWHSGHIDIKTVDLGRIKIARVGFSTMSGALSRFQQHWLVAEEGRGVKHFVDEQVLGLFEEGRFMDILKENGFRAEILRSPMPGRPRYLAVRQ
jgi:SAM-dependent methyltransferase